jgi:site-specific DNA-methyltransferase (adenine-specific)
MVELNVFYNEDCLEGMKRLPDRSIDMILCDLPYGTTQNKWDVIIPFDKLWEQYNRIIKDNGAIVMTASQPFTTDLIMSNRKMFRYEWIWEKTKSTGYLNARKMPMKTHENIVVFYKKTCTYNPQMSKGTAYKNNHKPGDTGENYGENNKHYSFKNDGVRFPKSILKIDSVISSKQIHSTQKPVALFEYLIRTYTNENEVVLDNCMGSGTTAIECLRTNRNYIGFELDEKYHQIATERVERERALLFEKEAIENE